LPENALAIGIECSIHIDHNSLGNKPQDILTIQYNLEFLLIYEYEAENYLLYLRATNGFPRQLP
jgi:hypothetical protein